ncbi:MAG TPA: CPBP family intramembrane glutamic endopeptidase [Bacillota bacterium]|nr:CPBP family intramembrane glutamic endopeptidase [Bacillota bacterium]
MDLSIMNIPLTLINGLITLAFFILAVIYFFLEARVATLASVRRTLLLSLTITLVNIGVILMTRYIIVFPESEIYNLNSKIFMIINILTAMFAFFELILYIRCGQQFAQQKGLAGSSYIRGEGMFSNIDWKLVLIPMPFFFIWTYLVFHFLDAQPTELVYALTPVHNDYKTFIYNILNASILAPLREEIVYRYFAMGLFYRWFGRGKKAVAINILVTSLIFAFAHSGVIINDLVKILQILPLGLAFGWIYHKKGLGNAILSHSIFNTITIIISFVVDAIY